MDRIKHVNHGPDCLNGMACEELEGRDQPVSRSQKRKCSHKDAKLLLLFTRFILNMMGSKSLINTFLFK